MTNANIMLPDLTDELKFKKIENVAVLDEEIEGDSEFDWLTPDLLPSYVDNTNRRCDQGDLVLITIGHTEADLPEVDQPPVVGYAKNFQVGDLNGRTAILADLYFMTEYFKLSMSFPRRSVEFYQDKDFIDIISLLRRRPARNLGLITCKSEKTMQ